MLNEFCKYTFIALVPPPDAFIVKINSNIKLLASTENIRLSADRLLVTPII